MTDGALIQNWIDARHGADSRVLSTLRQQVSELETSQPLAPVGVLFAVLGYALGTDGGWLAGQLMRIVAGQ